MSERGAVQDYASGLQADRSPEDRWLTVYEVAAMTLQHPDTVRRWVAEGLLKGEDRGPLGYRIRESEVERFLHDYVLVEGRSPADKALRSNLLDAVPANAPDEYEVAGAGWPFFGRRRDAAS